MRNLLLTYAGLLSLLALTVSMSLIHLGRLALVVSLLIACAKAGLIIWFFMELRQADALNRMVAAAGIIWLTILLSLSFADYLLRAGV